MASIWWAAWKVIAHYLTGNLKARKRVKYVKKLLDECGIDGERVAMYNMSSAQGQRFAEAAREMTERIKALGPNPAKQGSGVRGQVSGLAEPRTLKPDPKKGVKMIVANRKPFEEIMEMLRPYKKILLIGCNECVTVCSVGGTKEVEVLASEYASRGEKKASC